jgi:dihydrolipoamide dehydrogenase
MVEHNFDLIFLGGGPSGYQGAIRAAQLGQRVAVIEDRDLGGVCLNRGCIPTKTIRASAQLLSQARQAKNYGITIPEAQPDMPAIITRKNKVVSMLRGGVAQLFRANGIVLFPGRGEFLSHQELKVKCAEGATIVKGKKTVIATGSRPLLRAPFDVPIEGVITSDGILDINEVPKSLVVVGGGVIGLEMAAMMAALGSQVTVIEAREQILSGEDREIVAYLERMLKRQKIKLMTSSAVTAVDANNGVTLTLSNGASLTADLVLVATGRVPNTEHIGLKNIGLNYSGLHIPVNPHMETEVENIYAAGDIVGGWMLAHVAFMEGIVAAENAAGLPRIMDYRVVPRCIFTFPEFATVGLSEEEARQHYPAGAFTFPLKSLGMAQALGEWEGLIKLVVNTETDHILGGHIIGAQAAELVAEIALAMRNQVPAHGIINTLHIHPTMSEAVLEVAQASAGHAIHILP